MKALPLVLLVSLSLGLSASEVQVGDSHASVNATLGVPRGQLRIGNRQVLYFDRGEIELQAGTVCRVALLSVEDFAVMEAKRSAAVARAEQEREARRAQLSAEGESLLARKTADPVFQATPPAYQVAFWEKFSRQYPDVSCSDLLAIARQRQIEQLETRRIQYEEASRLAELEERVSETEARVAETRPVYHRTRDYRGSESGYQPSTQWPIEYHYFNVIHSAAASPGSFTQTATYRGDPPALLNYDPVPYDKHYMHMDNGLNKNKREDLQDRNWPNGHFRM